MKQKRAVPVLSLVLFILAAGLLLFSGIGGTRAALIYYSENYTSRVEMYDIGVTLNENGQAVSWRDYVINSDGEWKEATGELLGNMLPAGEELMLGKAYGEEISVTNSGSIDEYVRVSIYTYWLDQNGNKLQTLSPKLIDLHLVNLGSDWLLDEAAQTEERTVLYYNRILPAGSTSPILSDTLTVSGLVATKATQYTEYVDGYTRITTIYDYDGVRFCLEARVDAVQTHNAEAAIYSAWGRHVTISGDSLSLN